MNTYEMIDFEECEHCGKVTIELGIKNKKGDLNMYAITAKVKGINTIEGNYRNKMIAERHKRRLEKKYPSTIFKIEQVDKRDTQLNTYYAVIGHIEKGEL